MWTGRTGRFGETEAGKRERKGGRPMVSDRKQSCRIGAGRIDQWISTCLVAAIVVLVLSGCDSGVR